MTLGLLLAVPAVALADNVQNDLANSIDPNDAGKKVLSVQAGQTSSQVGYRINATAGDTGDTTGGSGERCNLVHSGSETVTITGLPSGVTVENLNGNTLSAPHFTFTQCGVDQFVKFNVGAAVAAGDYEIKVADIANVSPDPGTNDGFNESPATFFLRVTAPAPPADTTPPAPPTVDLAAASDSGNSTTDNITNDSTPTFNGTAEANSTVEVFAGTISLGTASADASGNWSLTVSSLKALSDGVHSITAKATDAALNTSQASSALSVRIDTVNPTVEVSGFSNGDIFYKGDPNATLPTPGCDVNDPTPTSGIYQQSGPSLKQGTGLNSEGVGSATYSCSAEDNAGNLGSDEESYSVLYARNGGILQPINPDNSSVFSRGRAVPVKFQLDFDQPNGFGTSLWTLQRIQVSCGNLAEELTTEPVSSVTPSSVFRYDSTADQYIYNADFRDKASGSCWYVSVNLNDGSAPLKSAYFKLQR
jgi:hypothetical protein